MTFKEKIQLIKVLTPLVTTPGTEVYTIASKCLEEVIGDILKTNDSFIIERLQEINDADYKRLEELMTILRKK